MKNRLFAWVMAFCVSFMHVQSVAFAADGREQSTIVQHYSDVTDIIGPIAPPNTGTDEDNKPEEGGEVTLPNTEEFQSNEDFKQYDPAYPKKDQYGDYILRVPDLKGRLTFSTGNKKQMLGTLYAPGISKSGGSKDATKLWGNHDSGLCFAASSSNLISWYLERYRKLHPEDKNVYETDVEKVFNRFRNGWDSATGGDPKEALSWYFTGGFPSGNSHPNDNHLTGEEKGGYLRGKIPNNTSERWADVSWGWRPEEVFSVFGGYSDNKFPFVEEVGGITGNGAFVTLEGFSEQVLRQLHYGACTISIITDQYGSSSGHAITLWGADYDVDTGLVTAIHVTDSDDKRGEFTVSIERGNSNGGVRLVDYPYHPPTGNSQKFTRIRGSIVLYAPDVVKSSQGYTGPDAVIDTLNLDSDGRGVDVQVSNISGHSLEYGYSYDENPEHVIRWQNDSYFSGLEPDQYYFFARVKETGEHVAGGVSAPSAHRVQTPSPVSQESVAALGLGTSIFRPYNGTHQYIWYGTERGSQENGSEEPILWRVLDTRANNNAEGVFLLSDKLYGTGKNGDLSFSEQPPYSNDYQHSSAKRWCQTFETKHFQAWEQAAILSTTKTDKQYSNVASGGITFQEALGILSNDKVFLPSVEEITYEKYGFGTEESRKGRYHIGSSSYWLRSPVMNGSDKAGYVNSVGKVVSHHTMNDYAARPAFNLDDSQILYAVAVGNGQFDDAIGLEKIQTVHSQDFRVVLKDANRDFRVSSSEITGQSGESVTLGYEGAKIGQTDNEYISIVLMDANGTTPIYYGKVALVQSVNGEFSFRIPTDLGDGTYVLKVFNEQYNGEKKSGKASEFCDVSLKVSNQPAVEVVTEVNLTVSAPVTGQQPQKAETDETGCTIERTMWTPDDDVFQADTHYTVSIAIKPRSDYAFTDDTVFNLNGKPIVPVVHGEEYVITYEDFPKTQDNNSGESSGGAGGEVGDDSTSGGGTGGEAGDDSTSGGGTGGEVGDDSTSGGGTGGEIGDDSTSSGGTGSEVGDDSTSGGGTGGEIDGDSTPGGGADSETDDGSTSEGDTEGDTGSSEQPNEEVGTGSGGIKIETVMQPDRTKVETTTWMNRDQPVAKIPTGQNSNVQSELTVSETEGKESEMADKPLEISSETEQSDKNVNSSAVTERDLSKKISQTSKHGYFGWILLGIFVPLAGFALFFVLKKMQNRKHQKI